MSRISTLDIRFVSGAQPALHPAVDAAERFRRRQWPPGGGDGDELEPARHARPRPGGTGLAPQQIRQGHDRPHGGA